MMLTSVAGMAPLLGGSAASRSRHATDGFGRTFFSNGSTYFEIFFFTFAVGVFLFNEAIAEFFFFNKTIAGLESDVGVSWTRVMS
jgi:hypothetical protein